MKRGKNSQKGENQNQESWADLPGEWEPELFEWDIQPFEWELIPFEWDFTPLEWEPDSNDSNDNRNRAESLDNKGKETKLQERIRKLEAEKEYHDYKRWNFLPKSIMNFIQRRIHS